MTGVEVAAAAESSTGATAVPVDEEQHGFWWWSLRPIALYVASRLGVFLIAGAVGVVTGRPTRDGLVTWDAKWYLSIARSGYVTHIPPGHGDPAQSNLAFFPLLPMLTRGTRLFTGLAVEPAALVTVFIVGLLAAVAVWWLLRDIFDVTGADRGTALILFSPGAFVLSMAYTEAATMLFVTCSLLALRRQRWVLAGLAAAVATTADPVGAAAVVPCVVACVIAIRTQRAWRSLAAPLIAPLGIGTFFAYLWVHAGSPFEYIKAQRAGWQSGTYFGGIPRAFGHLIQHGFGDPNYGVKAISILVTIGLLVIFFRARPPAPWVGYVVAVLGFGALSPIIGVTPRLLLRGFVLLGVVGARLPRFWFELVLGLSALCMAALGTMAMGSPHWTP